MTTSGVVVSSLVETVFTVLVFSLIPLVLYMNGGERKTIKGFLRSVGIYKCPKSQRRQAVLVLLSTSVVAFATTSAVLISGNSGRHLGETRNFTTLTFCIYLLFHGLRTGISEEILFRGFVGKKLIRWLGFVKGNILQALVFGLVHLPLMGPTATTADRVAKLSTACLLGYAFGYVMERKCDGSIMPAIIGHGLYNIVASLLLGVVHYFIY